MAVTATLLLLPLTPGIPVLLILNPAAARPPHDLPPNSSALSAFFLSDHSLLCSSLLSTPKALCFISVLLQCITIMCMLLYLSHTTFSIHCFNYPAPISTRSCDLELIFCVISGSKAQQSLTFRIQTQMKKGKAFWSVILCLVISN